MNVNLNDLLIPNAEGPDQPLTDPRATSADGLTQVFFRNLEAELLQLINAADVVVGCVAWLTNSQILAALAKKESVAIVIQKQDFLRPDLGVKKNWSLELRSQYSRLKCTFDRYNGTLGGTALHYMSMCGDLSITPIRCVGNHNSDKQPAFPRAHHKFLVFGRSLNSTEHEDDSELGALGEFQPHAAWTGSFNLTFNAMNSFENAIVSKYPQLVQAFFEEWSQIKALSEPLDWSSVWVETEWRIGT